jgi:hypothetical protein
MKTYGRLTREIVLSVTLGSAVLLISSATAEAAGECHVKEFIKYINRESLLASDEGDATVDAAIGDQFRCTFKPKFKLTDCLKVDVGRLEAYSKVEKIDDDISEYIRTLKAVIQLNERSSFTYSYTVTKKGWFSSVEFTNLKERDVPISGNSVHQFRSAAPRIESWLCGLSEMSEEAFVKDIDHIFQQIREQRASRDSEAK